MKKYLKGFLSVLSASALVATITSCDAARNTKRPDGGLNLTETYASASGVSVTNNEMYNLFRNKGYSNVLKEIKNDLFKNEIAAVSRAKHEKEYNEYILNAIYGVSTFTDYDELEEKDVNEKVTKFIDSQMTNNGIDLTSQKDALKPAKNLEIDSRVDWPLELVEQYTYTIAIIDYAKEYVNAIKNQAKVTDDDGDEIDNTYFIDDKKLEDTFNDTYKDYTSYADILGIKYPNQEDREYANHAIVVQFGNKAQAEKYIKEALTASGLTSLDENTTKEDALKFYINLYNSYYKDRPLLTSDTVYTDENTRFTITEEENQFSKLPSGVQTFLKDNLADLDLDSANPGAKPSERSFLYTPFNLTGDNSYYMVLRLNIFEGKEYDEVISANPAIKDTLDKQIEADLIESWASESLGNTLVEKRLKNSGFDLAIFDPVFENQYANSYTDYYDFTNKFNNNNVYEFTYSYTSDPVYSLGTYSGNFKPEGELKEEYSVVDFFNDSDTIYGISQALDLLATKYLVNEPIIKNQIEDEALKGYRDGLRSTIKSFRRNETSYSKKMGVENFLVLQYGFASQEDVLNYNLLKSQLVSTYNSYYGEFNGEVKDNLTMFKDNGLFAKFKQFTDKEYDNYYSLNIAHMLLSIDTNQDGTYEDPKEFLADLEANRGKEAANAFKNTLIQLADALVKEAEIITSNKKVEVFQFLAKTFNNQGYTYVLKSEEYKGKTWNDLKNGYDLVLTAEDLSTIDTTTGSNYVEEFTEEVKNIYKTLNQEEYKDIKENIEDNGYWKYNDTVAAKLGVASYDELTATTYGWHMLYAYNMKDVASSKFLKADDSTNSEGKGTWEDQDIVVYKHDTTTTSDDYVVYASGYTAKETEEALQDKPSIDQLFIYFMEYLNNGSVTSMRSSVSTAVGSVFSTTISRYTSSDFQMYRLYKQLGSVIFGSNNDEKAKKLTTFLEIKERTIDSYKTLEESDTFYGWFDIDWTIDFQAKVFNK